MPETPARRDTRRPRACALPGREEGARKRGGPRCAAPVRSRQRPAGQGTRAVAGGHAAADAANTVARSGHLAKRIVCVRAPSIGTRGVGTRQTTVMGSPTTHACYGQVPGWLGVRAGLEKDKCATRAPLATTVVHSSSQQRTGPRYRHTCLAHCRHQRSGGGGDTIGCV